MLPQLNPCDFAAWREQATASESSLLPVVLDVRETWELQTSSLKADGFTLVHISMHEIPARLEELQKTWHSDQPIACLCHHGMRSLQVATYLTQAGFAKVVNLQGGINAWSQQVDASVARY